MRGRIPGRLATLLLGGSLCCQTSIVEAKEETAVDLTELSLEELVQIEIPSVVGASKYEQKSTIAPSSVSVITAEEIRKYGYLKLSEILRAVRGFYLGNDHNYEFLGVRGFSLPGDYNSRVLVLIDGHRVNDPIYQQGLIGGDLPFDVDLIDRVEVIRGPGSSLYGTSAFFAVVNIIPKRGKDIQGVEIAAGGGNFDTKLGRVSVGKKLANGVDFLLSASGYDRSGQDTLIYPELAGDPTRNNGIYDQGDTEQWKNFYASLNFGNFTLEAVQGTRDKTYGPGLYGTAFNTDANYTVDRHEHIDLQYQRAFGEERSMYARLYYDRYDYWADYTFLGFGTNHDDLDSQWWGAEYRYLTKLGAKHRLTLGAEYVDYFQQDQINRDVDPVFQCLSGVVPTLEPCLDSREKSKTWGVFAQDEFAVTNKITLNLGVRYDDLYRGRSSTNPRAGLIYNPTDNTAWKLLYGTAFRAPNGYEQYYTGVDYAANPDLRPEKIKTLEAAVEHSFSKRLRGIASLYEYRISDLILLNNEAGTLVFRNLSNVKARGLDLELQAKWTKLEGRVSYSNQRVKDSDTGATFVNAPRHLAKLNLMVPFLQDKLFAGFEAQYVSKRLNVQNTTGTRVPEVPGYTTANLTLTNRDWIKGLDVSFGVYNMFDKQYRDVNSGDDDDAITEGNPQEGRSLRLKLAYRF